MKNDYYKVRQKLEQHGLILCSDFVNYNSRNALQRVKCVNCGYTFVVDINSDLKCPSCVRQSLHSLRENDIDNILKTRGIWAHRNYKMQVPGRSYALDLDLYVPDRGFAIECDSYEFHNETKVYNDYHRFKTIECLKQGIQLYHVWNAWRLTDVEVLIDAILGHHYLDVNGSKEAKKGSIIRVSRDVCPSVSSNIIDPRFQFLYEEPPTFKYWVSSDYKGTLPSFHGIKPGTVYLSEAFDGQSMIDHGIYKVYDSGTMVFRALS